MLRILDANLNRLGEGLRLLEDISRFTLNDADLSEQLKTLRHDLLPREQQLHEKLLSARRSEEDVGASLELASEGERPDVASLVRANSRRVQQSLRIIEEITKIPGQDFGFNWENMKRARFTVYELEQRIFLRLSRYDKTERISGLYLILDTEALGNQSEVEVARQAVQGGASTIQLRDKMRPKAELVSLAQDLREVCAESGALFIVNDYLDVALASDADGLHLGHRRPEDCCLLTKLSVSPQPPWKRPFKLKSKAPTTSLWAQFIPRHLNRGQDSPGSPHSSK